MIYRRTIKLLLIILLSGAWLSGLAQTQVFEGKPEITRMGDCRFDTTGLYDMRLEIRKEGEQLSITQYEHDPSKGWIVSDRVTWSGEVVNEKCYRLKRMQRFTCSGQDRFETTAFVAVIRTLNNEQVLYLDAIVVWCPASNCVFKMAYRLKKKS
jgi:hypothetical protein